MKVMMFRCALTAGLIALCGTAFAQATSTSSGQAWPNKPVKIIVPYAPGGAVDVVTRKMAAKLQEQTRQTFFVENKAGATGTIGISQAVQSAPDGYTLVANDTTYALLPHIFKKLPFDYAHDLIPVSAFVFAPMGVVVKADSRFKTLGDLLHADRAGRAGTVLDEEALAGLLRELLGHLARDHVHGAAGRVRHDDAHRVRGIGVGQGSQRRQCSCQAGERCAA